MGGFPFGCCGENWWEEERSRFSEEFVTPLPAALAGASSGAADVEALADQMRGARAALRHPYRVPGRPTRGRHRPRITASALQRTPACSRAGRALGRCDPGCTSPVAPGSGPWKNPAGYIGVGTLPDRAQTHAPGSPAPGEANAIELRVHRGRGQEVLNLSGIPDRLGLESLHPSAVENW